MIVPYDNSHYKEVVTDKSWKTETKFKITNKQASSRSDLESNVSLGLGACAFIPGPGMIAGVAGMGVTLGSKNDPYKEWGTYLVQSKSEKTYEVHRLTGKRTLLSEKRLVTVTLTLADGEKKTKDFTINIK